MLFNLRTTMRDGVALSSDVYLPSEGEGPWPAVVCRTPYDNTRHGEEATRFAERGFVAVIQDVRGRGDSDGEFDMWRQEGADGRDTVEWLARQPWCDGSIGMFGGSYQSYCSWAMFRDGPTQVGALLSRATSGFWLLGLPHDIGTARPYWLWVFHMTAGRTLQVPLDSDPSAPRWDRVLRDVPLGQMDTAIGRPLAIWQRMLATDFNDEYVADLSLQGVFDHVSAPVLHVTGWFDAAQWGELNTWTKSVARSASGHQMIIGPWDHYGTGGAPSVTGGRNFGDSAAVDMTDLMIDHFDRTLKQSAEVAVADEPAVRYFVMGSNEWATSDCWPLRDTVESSLYFHSDGSADSPDGGVLSSLAPDFAEPADVILYDPLDATPSAEHAEAPFTAPLNLDNRWMLERSDVLSYTTSPLEDTVEAVGNPRAVLYVDSDCLDTDFYVAVCDVLPDGTSYLVSDGFLRASYRHGTAPRTPLERHVITRLEIDLMATANRWRLGHRIRVLVASAHFPNVDRNPNTGAPIAGDGQTQVARNTVHHSMTHSSHLLLPVRTTA